MNPLPLVAVAGSPNAGKSALFNALTGARQKVGNYPGVTVERHSGRLTLGDGRPVELIDLPGAYSLEPASPDEAVQLLGAAEQYHMDQLAHSCLHVISQGLDVHNVSYVLQLAIDRNFPDLKVSRLCAPLYRATFYLYLYLLFLFYFILLI